MAVQTPSKGTSPQILRMTTEVVAAYLRHNALPGAQISDVIGAVFRSLHRLQSGGGSEAPAAARKPAVPIHKSIYPDYLVCLEDGRKRKMLKRHLKTVYNLTPEQYRQKWGLPSDYPMVAPNYAEQRSSFAKKIGLGRGGSARKN